MSETTRQKAPLLVAVGASAGICIGVFFVFSGNDDEDLPSAPTFSVNLATFGEETLEPYATCEDLKTDLHEAAKYLANNHINSEAQWYYHHKYHEGSCAGCSFGNFNRGRPGMMYAMEDTVSANSQATNSRSSSALPDQGGEDSFGTNNQVEGVDEADMVKSDGVSVFAAYGDEVVVWDAVSGVVRSRTAIPLSQEVEGNVDCYSSIQNLLLFESRLVAITTGYCYEIYGPYYDDAVDDANEDVDDVRILSNYGSQGGTRVFVFDTSSDDDVLPVVAKTSLQGYYLSARSIESNVHVVTTSYVDSYSVLTQHLSRYNGKEYSSLLENQYRSAAHDRAASAIPAFVDRLFEELTEDAGCESYARLSMLQNSGEQLGFSGGGQVLTAMTSVSSFDLDADLESSFEISSSAMFLPTAYSHVYASQFRLFLAGQGWNVDAANVWHEETFLVGFQLEGASSTAVSFGKVPGYLINSFAMDHRASGGVDYLRVATTNSASWGVVGEGWGQTTESSSQITVLQIPNNASGTSDLEMQVVGQATDIGLTETIYAVRFQGDRGYVVTFRQTDPFYTVDLSDPFEPRVVGELKIDGFSNYLQPIGNGSLVLAVGQNADPETGRQLGLQISLFDVNNFMDPQQIQVYSVADGEESASYSDAQYDHHAFRYLEGSKVLIIPMQVYTWNSDSDNDFDGFSLFDVDAEAGINPRFTITHADSMSIYEGCWSYDSQLQARSLVFDGNVMTLKGHTVLSHDIVTQEETFPVLNLDAGLGASDCSDYFAYH